VRENGKKVVESESNEGKWEVVNVFSVAVDVESILAFDAVLQLLRLNHSLDVDEGVPILLQFLLLQLMKLLVLSLHFQFHSLVVPAIDRLPVSVNEESTVAVVVVVDSVTGGEGESLLLNEVVVEEEQVEVEDSEQIFFSDFSDLGKKKRKRQEVEVVTDARNAAESDERVIASASASGLCASGLCASEEVNADAKSAASVASAVIACVDREEGA